MEAIRPFQIDDVTTIAALVAVAQDIPINNRTFMISNTGAQPLYFKPKNKGVATAANGFLVPAGQVFPQFFSCDGMLSVISNATGTSVSILYLEV